MTASIRDAIQLSPENGLAWARLADLRFSLGDYKNGIEAARRAVALNPELAHAYAVLGFAALVDVDMPASKLAFENAIRRDSAAFLPRLGLGLALIREGKLAEGRAQIETAACLDPSNSLTWSYLRKAYYDEKQDAPAFAQYRMAQTLDPQDPTSYYYEAILKQTRCCSTSGHCATCLPRSSTATRIFCPTWSPGGPATSSTSARACRLPCSCCARAGRANSAG